MRNRLTEYAGTFLRDVEWGLIDGDGGFYLRLANEVLEIAPDPGSRDERPQPVPLRRNLFSDLDQWMLKLLVSPELAPTFQLRDVHGAVVDRPLQRISDLARRAGVAIGTAHGFVRRLRENGYCAPTGPLQLQDLSGLLRRWLSVPAYRAEIRARFVLPGPDFGDRFQRFIRSKRSASDQVGLGQFGGIEMRGLRHVLGVPPLVHAQLPNAFMEDMGLVNAEQGAPAEVAIRIPAFPQSTFRGLTQVGGIPVADAIQCLIDISSSDARGPEMTQLLREQLFATAVDDWR